MRNYWTCSTFADWLRGTAKLKWGTSKEWANWKRASKESHPFRYWLAEEGLDHLQDIWCYIPERINDVRYYLNNRYTIRSHSLTAHPRDIKPGTWSDVGNRFLPCMFNELVNFVEVEKAWMHVCWGDDETRNKYNVPYWRKQWYTRWFMEWRCPQAGLDHLDWEIGLTYNEEWIEENNPLRGKPTSQAIGAKEVKELYLWWTEERPKRPDPYDVSGWTAICEKRREAFPDEMFPEDSTAKDKRESKKALDKLHKLELQYEQEDEKMMIRLIKARQSLWT